MKAACLPLVDRDVAVEAPGAGIGQVHGLDARHHTLDAVVERRFYFFEFLVSKEDRKEAPLPFHSQGITRANRLGLPPLAARLRYYLKVWVFDDGRMNVVHVSGRHIVNTTVEFADADRVPKIGQQTRNILGKLLLGFGTPGDVEEIKRIGDISCVK